MTVSIPSYEATQRLAAILPCTTQLSCLIDLEHYGSSNSSLPSSVLYRKSVDIYGTPVDSFVNAAHLSPHALLRTPPRTYYQRMNPFSLLGSNFDLGVGSNAAKRTDMYVDYAKDMVPDLRKEWMNPGGVTKNYVSELGRIMSRRDTKLSRRNQRRLTKLVKRARAAGSISIFTKTVPKDKPRDPTRGWGVDRDRRDAGRTSAF
ncbi:hypothetical protein BT69DRAFT_1297930 [Atractiella rhizophila]|nr:hypothetical protein BT69DRAFT_1297930 [Atractiella rhizophila]